MPGTSLKAMMWAPLLAGFVAAAAVAVSCPAAAKASRAGHAAGAAGRAAVAPEMVTINPGEFSMGAPDHGPPHSVKIGYAFAVSRYPITVAEFGRFARETNFDTGNHCWTHVGSVLHDTFTTGDWKDPHFPQGPKNPVVCVSWNEAQEYADWVSKKTGQTYRLLTEAEYEYVDRAGTTTPFWWGEAAGAGHANCKGCGSAWDEKSTSPVGSFAPNAFGLYDTSGNVWEWTADCWLDAYTGAPADGSANATGDCIRRPVRGGSYGHEPPYMRVFERHGIPPDVHDQHIGFRLARTL